MNIFRNATDAKSLPAGSVLFEKGDPGESMFAVVDGEIEVVLGDRVLSVLKSGDVFGEMALIEKSPRTATARARIDSRIVEIDERRFLFLVQQTPFFALELMRTMSSRLRERLAEIA